MLRRRATTPRSRGGSGRSSTRTLPRRASPCATSGRAPSLRIAPHRRQHRRAAATTSSSFAPRPRAPHRGACHEVPATIRGGDFTYRLKSTPRFITAKDAVIMPTSTTTRESVGRAAARRQITNGRRSRGRRPRPGYTTRNPFSFFREAIPGRVRAELMNEMSGALIGAMVKADVCNGSAATFAIRRPLFWRDVPRSRLRIPRHRPSSASPTGRNRSDVPPRKPPISGSRAPSRRGLKKVRPRGLGVEDLWGRQGSLEKKDRERVHHRVPPRQERLGPSRTIGQMPETMWVVDYGNFEFLMTIRRALSPVGRAPHKLGTWRTMSHRIRAHGETRSPSSCPRSSATASVTSSRRRLGAFDTVMNGDGIPEPPRRPDRRDAAGRISHRAQGKHLGPEIAGFTALDPDPMSAPPSATGSLRLEKGPRRRALRSHGRSRAVTEAFPSRG